MKKILITTMFLCSLSALNAQTGPIHPKEPDFFTEKKPTMQKYQFEMPIQIELPPCAEKYFVEKFLTVLQSTYDFEFTIKQISYGKTQAITYVFYTSDNRLFFQLGVFVGTLHSMCELHQVESN
jgi:hypothetical protein